MKVRPNKYAFISMFSLTASQEEVRAAILDTSEWKSWWKSVQELTAGKENGKDMVAVTLGHFGYELQFAMRMLEENDNEFSFNATGDLEGKGRFVFSELPDTKGTLVIFHWNIKTNKPWMNVLAPVLSRMLILFHSLVMQEFAHGLAHKLHAEVLTCTSVGKRTAP